MFCFFVNLFCYFLTALSIFRGYNRLQSNGEMHQSINIQVSSKVPFCHPIYLMVWCPKILPPWYIFSDYACLTCLSCCCPTTLPPCQLLLLQSGWGATIMLLCSDDAKPLGDMIDHLSTSTDLLSGGRW